MYKLLFLRIIILVTDDDDEVWIADFGATDYMTHWRECFPSFEAFLNTLKVKIGDQSTIDAVDKRTVKTDAEYIAAIESTKDCV